MYAVSTLIDIHYKIIVYYYINDMFVCSYSFTMDRYTLQHSVLYIISIIYHSCFTTDRCTL